MSDSDPERGAVDCGVAVIGLSGRFPGAPNVDAFWRNLREGVESVRFFEPDEIEPLGPHAYLQDLPNYVRAKPILDDVELFDAGLFGMSPREAELLDPQQRIFLECAWEALEHAGYDPYRYDGLIGVNAGVALSSYLMLHALPNLGGDPIGMIQALMGGSADNLTMRAAFHLDLRGPVFSVQSNCSTSLVAVHDACRSLLSYESDIMLAGGAAISLPQKAGYLHTPGGMDPPDGHCRAFDARGDGTTLGNGVAVVVLKRLAEALADGDGIHAVIRGSAVSNDGASKMSFTAPSVVGIAEAVREALSAADVDARSVGYVEAHGTGTRIGDPIEIAALTRAFRSQTQDKQFCAIGSLKTNVGHLDRAAGVAGLIKAALALREGEIPPSLHYERPNPECGFEQSPFFVNTELRRWERNGAPRRAGVSSFGIGGTNAHVILEEAPEREASGPSRPRQLLVWSARCKAALEQATDRLADHLEAHPEVPLADVAHTLAVGRRVLEERRALVCDDAQDAARALRARDPKRLLGSSGRSGERAVAFLFPGLGEQHVGMGRELYDQEPDFRAALDRCALHLKERHGLHLLELLYAAEGVAPRGPDLRRMLGRAPEAGRSPLDATQHAQPALFAIEWSLAQLWQAWGIRPGALAGYSLGEYTAACVSGVFTVEDALDLVVDRARAIAALEPGAMLAVSLSEQELAGPLAEWGLSLSAVNGPQLCVIGGARERVAVAEQALAARGVLHRRLATEHAFHSSLMDPLVEGWRERMARVPLREPNVPWVSNLSGEWIRPDEATDPEYWARHLREPVRFGAAIECLWRDESRVLLEVGPGNSLGSTAMQHPAGAARADRVVLCTLGGRHDERAERTQGLDVLAKLWLAGCDVDWAGFRRHERRQRVALPTYPFQRQRYWIEATPPGASPASQADVPDLERKPALEDWIYAPVWKRTPLVEPDAVAEGTRWLLFADAGGVADALAQRLEAAGADVRSVRAGTCFERLDPGRFRLAPASRDDHHALLQTLAEEGFRPERIVHLWSVDRPGEASAPLDRLREQEAVGFHALIALAQALDELGGSELVELRVVSSGVHEVVGREALCPEKALLIGPCKVVAKELAHVVSQGIDVDPDDGVERVVAHLWRELLAEPEPEAEEVAYRGAYRWVREFEALPIAPVATGPLRPGGTYLITGGLGGLGAGLAEQLVERVDANLVLVGRTALPPRESWEAWLADHDVEDGVSQRIRRVQQLEGLGADVLVVAADVADLAAMQAAVAAARERFGRIDGAFHLAGVPGAGLIQLKTPEMAAAVLAPKVQGTLVLDAVLASEPPDFLVLYSSIVAIATGFGEVDYCAANAFLDAFAHYRTRVRGQRTLSVNWGTWEWDAWHAQFFEATPEVLEALRAYRARTAMSLAEGADCLFRLLAQDLPQAVVSTQDLDTQIRLRREHLHTSKAAAVLPQAGSLHERPCLANPFVAPRSELEEQVAGVIRETLGIAEVGIHDSFFDLGGSSLVAMGVCSRLEQVLGERVTLRAFLSHPTVAELAAAISDPSRAACAVDFRTETQLPVNVRPPEGTVGEARRPGGVLLTGATGFLGAFLLGELLDRTEARVSCLVRAADEREGRERLLANLRSYGIEPDRHASRIDVVPGDLAEPEFGLAPRRWAGLADSVDLILHNGAEVNLVLPYASLARSNVFGTLQALRLASEGRPKRLHYVSSIGVFPEQDAEGDAPTGEGDVFDRPELLESGYDQTKWVAEALVREAGRRGIPVAIHRAGIVTGHSETGVLNQRIDWIWYLLPFCVAMGSVPEVEVEVDLAPVDWVSRVLVALSLREESEGRTYHVVPPRRVAMSSLVSLLDEMGYGLRRLPFEAWRARLDEVVAGSDSETAASLLALAPQWERPPRFRRFAAPNLESVLRDEGIRFPPLDDRALRRFFDRLVKVGFLPPPGSEAGTGGAT